MANTGDPNGAGSILGPSQNTVLAGGRYDYLASYLLGKGKPNEKRQKLPAIGWAAGIDRLALIVDALNAGQL